MATPVYGSAETGTKHVSGHKDSLTTIVYVIGQLGVGGTERQLLALVQRLDRRQFQPYVICLSQDDTLSEPMRQAGCPVYVVPRERLGLARTWLGLLSHLRKLRPAIVHVFAYARYLAIPAAWVARVPHVVVAERTVPLWKASWPRLLDRVLLRYVDLALANADRVRQAFWLDLGLPAERCRVIYNGLDLAAFDAQQQASLTAPIPDGTEHSLSGHVICAVANAEPKKCLNILIQAYALVCQQHPDTNLWIVGEGKQEPELVNLAESLKIANRVHFWGRRYDVPAILRYATMGVLSSRIEGCANALLEYMAAGLPVVATRVGGNPELVLEGETGLLVPFGNPQALADAILYLLQHPDVARQYGIAGRHRVEQCFSMELMMRETEKVYLNLVNHDRS